MRVPDSRFRPHHAQRQPQVLGWLLEGRDSCGTWPTDSHEASCVDTRTRRQSKMYTTQADGKEKSMSKSLNRVTLLGHAGKDPQVHILPSGTLVNLSLATSERFKDSRGEWQERTEWHNLVGYQRT